MRKEKLYKVLLEPHVSEKANKSMVNERQYAFKVDKNANKSDVKTAVEKMFNVNVKSVNICNFKGGNLTRQGKAVGKRASWKKAYIILTSGQEINLA
ncbi:MAG: 50S ribosomal protein L23 [Gammaproteobacteria bacterium RIFCSPHIGHO2_12_FULL_38_14]|nr:MAG: 50S ribosomal protein L23 [Gammaproteobacteria bacterium RIFCSPHIGHO2_12_FULL_38_14]